MTDHIPAQLRRRRAAGTETEKAESAPEGTQMGRSPSGVGRAQPNYETSIAREEAKAIYEHSVSDIGLLEEHEKSGRAMNIAKELVDRYSLDGFVRWWNNGDPDGTFISNLDHLKQALDLHFGSSENPVNVYRPLFEADDELRRLIEKWMDSLLFPVIEASFSSGLKRELTRWAQETLRSAELREASPAPFCNLAEWLRWSAGFGLPAPPREDEWRIKYERRHGLVIPDPYSGAIFPDAVEEALAVHALLENIDLAHEQGWLTKLPLHQGS